MSSPTTSQAFTQLPLQALFGRFASGEPTPGGGSAAALAGALGASLAQMVGSLTVGKVGYEGVSAEVTSLRSGAESLAGRLSEAIAADAASYEGVMQAMSLPKATDDEKASRKAAMQKALKEATMTPLGVAKACVEVAQLGLRLLTIGNENASTDSAVSVLLALAGAEGALLNVAVNLSSIKDEAFVGARRDDSDELWEELERLRSDLWPSVRACGLAVPR